jgi:DivIVA domain-containing protein
MTWFFAVLIVLAMGAVAVVAAGHGAPLGPAYDDRPDVDLPAEGPLTAEDLRGLRLTTAVRGYRTDEVDALIDRLAAQLEQTRDPGQPGEPGEPGPVGEDLSDR